MEVKQNTTKYNRICSRDKSRGYGTERSSSRLVPNLRLGICLYTSVIIRKHNSEPEIVNIKI